MCCEMPLFRLLFLLLLFVPLIEVYLLIKVGTLIGVIPTVALVVFTAVLGAQLMRHQGLATLTRVQTMLARGELPAMPMLEGVAILVSGALLLTPGFLTDTIGFLGLIPPVRRAAVRFLLRRGVVHPVAGYGPPPPGRHHDPNVIEGDFTREDD